MTSCNPNPSGFGVPILRDKNDDWLPLDPVLPWFLEEHLHPAVTVQVFKRETSPVPMKRLLVIIPPAGYWQWTYRGGLASFDFIYECQSELKPERTQ